MHTYIDLYFAPDGVSPLEIADRLQTHAHLSFIVGSHDLVFEWTTVDEFRTTLSKIHLALRGTGATYRVQSMGDSPDFSEPPTWPPPLSDAPASHPGYGRTP
jgi:hypothetical protein